MFTDVGIVTLFVFGPLIVIGLFVCFEVLVHLVGLEVED